MTSCNKLLRRYLPCVVCKQPHSVKMATVEDSLEADQLAFAVEGDENIRHRTVERCNLLNMLKISIKSLIDSSMRLGRSLNDDHPKLQQFLILMEHILRHRLKSRRSLLGQKKSFWGVIESFEKTSSEFAESVMNVKALPGVKTMVGRGRAWLRFVLMQKKLSDKFRTMVESRQTLSDWYEPEAIMLNEEGVVISGLLMGLNCIDYNVLMRGEEFDRSLGVIDFSQYLRDGNYLGKPAGQEEDDEESGLSQLLDQKAYLEELNRKLESSVETLQGKLVLMEKENTENQEKVKSLEENVNELSLERDSLRVMNERSSADLRRALECLQEDQKTELDTYLQTRAGLNQLYSASQKTLGTEQKLRQQLEQELELHKNARQEKETALQLLETSVHEKQDTIIGLRKQMEELKTANLKMSTQIKIANETHQRDSLKIRSLEAKLSQLTAHTKTMEKQLTDKTSQLTVSQKTLRDVGAKMEEVQLARSSAENDLAIEKQWRAALQMEIQREKDRVVELTNETKKFKTLKKENAELMEKYSALQETVSDQEIAMVEMGRQLSLSQQKVSQMKEVNTMMKESVWLDDKSITDCQSCKKPFSVARRKHHCRNCGGVFCYACSENSLQLASSSKPVRVCDSCYSLLLERSST